MTTKQKSYVVWKGRKTGVFETWDECQLQVKGYPGAKYRSFDNLQAAEQAFQCEYEDYLLPQHSKPAPTRPEAAPIIPSFCVDASCIGNPGVLEFHCVNTETGEEVFAEGPFQQGTNNIGEFLAIVQALTFCQKVGIIAPVYTDSRNAMIWVHKKKCKTRLIRDERNIPLFELIALAETWLQNNSYQNSILKWVTEKWGEIPADYGRK